MQRSLLSRHVWRGRQTCGFGQVVATGHPEFDRHLPGGGWPQGAVTEIHLARYGIGELSLLMPALARLSNDQTLRRWIVWIAPPFMPYAPALVRHGLSLDRQLLVHPSPRSIDGLWAIEQALRSGGSAAVLAWVRDADRTALRRLQLAAEEQQCWAVLFRPLAMMHAGSPAALRIALSARGSKTCIDILKCRGAGPASIELDLGRDDAGRYGYDGSAGW